jgi:hypothetical protein
MLSSVQRSRLTFALGRTKAKLLALFGAAHTVKENPLAPTMLTALDHEIKPPAVTMAPGLPDGFGLASRQLVQLSLSHRRPTFEHGSRRIPTDFREGVAAFDRGIIAESTDI